MRRAHQRALSLSSFFLVLSWLAPTALAQGEKPLPRLFPAELHASVASVRVRGSDPAGPRRLELWAWRIESFERIASVSSAPDGGFDFGEIPLPQQGLSLAVTIQGGRPSVDDVVLLESPIPAPKIAPSLGGSQMELIVHPARYEGELRFRDDATGTLIARWPIDVMRERTSVIDLFQLIGPNPPREIRVQQVLEDGRVSPPAFYRFDSRVSPD
jgi:hypothetical protein